MFEEAKCKACESMFLKTALTEDGRCKTCVKDGRLAGSEEEVEYIKSEKQKIDELKALIKQVLQELKDEEIQDKNEKIFEPRKCKKCGAEFIPMAANNTICRECKGEK